MRKLNSLNLGALLTVLLLSGCGMPGPLYQTPEQTLEIKTDEAPSNTHLSDKTVQEN